MADLLSQNIVLSLATFEDELCLFIQMGDESVLKLPLRKLLSVIFQLVIIFYMESKKRYDRWTPESWFVGLVIAVRTLVMLRTPWMYRCAVYIFELAIPKIEVRLYNWLLSRQYIVNFGRAVGKLWLYRVVRWIAWEVVALGAKFAIVVYVVSNLTVGNPVVLAVPKVTWEIVFSAVMWENVLPENYKSRIFSAIIAPVGRFLPNMCYRTAVLYTTRLFGYSMIITTVVIVTAEFFIHSSRRVRADYWSTLELKFFYALEWILSFLIDYTIAVIYFVLPNNIKEKLKFYKGFTKRLANYVDEEDISNVMKSLEEINTGYLSNKTLFLCFIPFLPQVRKRRNRITLMARGLHMLVKPSNEPKHSIDRFNPLHVAVVCGNVKNVKYILNRLKGFDVNELGMMLMVDSTKQTALMMACSMEDREQIISLLLAHPKIDVNVKGDNDLTALKIVFKKVLAGKCMQSFKLLMRDKSLDVNTKLDGNRTPLMMAIDHLKNENERETVVNLIVKHPTLDVNARGNTNNDYTALHHAVEEDQPKTVKVLLKISKILVNAKTKSNETSLILAALRNNPHCLDIIKLLIAKKNIDINAVDNESYTAMGRALNNQNSKVVELLYNNKKFDGNQPFKVSKLADKIDEDVKNSTKLLHKRQKCVRCCWCCGEEDVKLYKCGGCKKAFYCGDKCIRADWPVHGRWCSKMEEKRKKKKNEQ